MEEQNVQSNVNQEHVAANSNNIPPKNKNPYNNKSVKWGGRIMLLLIILILIGMLGDSKGWFEKKQEHPQNVTDYVIPEGTIQIESDAFKDNTNLKVIIIPSSVKNIGKCAFMNCTQLESVIFEKGSQLLNIGDSAFYLCANLKHITLPEDVQRIGVNAFAYCEHLQSVVIPNSVTSIEDNAFYNCYGLTSVTIGNNVTSIGNNAFYNCNHLTSITIPNGVTSIEYNAFHDCSSLTSVTLSESLTSINSGAFNGCSINEIYYNGTIQELCTRSNYLTSISGHYNLYVNGNLLQDLTIPNQVTYIRDCAFRGCKSLTSVTIPNSVTSIGDFAFLRCINLTNINVASDNTNYSSKNGVLFNKNQSSLITYPCRKQGPYTVPNSVREIIDCAFENCVNLTSVTIPNSVTKIGESAFGSCESLTSVTIPNSVTSIGDYAFYHCKNLTLSVPEKFKGEVNFYGCKEVIYY